MALQVNCPACGKTISIDDEQLGRAGRCPFCLKKVPVIRANAVEPPRGEAATRGTVPAAKRTAQADVAKLEVNPIQPKDLPGRIGRFEIRTRLGEGNFGTVYRAYDPQLEREVALKVPRVGTLDNPKRVERFLREAKASAQLRHPHVVPVYDAGRDGEQYYIAAAFIDGNTLAHAIDESTLDVHRSARIVRDLAEALAYAHGIGIVHRDVKPANIMLDTKGRAHLMDFGLARRQDEADKLTQDGAIMGTPAYMAPEQARGAGGEAQPASDQYSLGVTLYELLCGKTPFSGPPEIVIFHVLNQEPPAPRSIKPEIPLDLETICLKAMAKRLEDRYADCQEMADDLRRWLENEPIQARRLGVAERMVRWCRKEPKLAVAATVTVGCLVAVAVVSTGTAAKLAASFQRESEARKAAEQAQNEAEGQQQAAEKSRQEAEAARQQAESARTDAADKARSEAEQKKQVEAALAKVEELRKAEAEAREKEEEQRRQTEEALAKAESNTFFYFHRVALADRSFRDHPAHADRLLNECPKGLRRWEWHYVKRQNPCALLTIKTGAFSSYSAVFSPDGQRLAYGSGGNVHIVDAATGEELFTLKGHKSPGTSVAWSHDGKFLASASPTTTPTSYNDVGGIWIWDTSSGKQIGRFGTKLPAQVLAFSPDNKCLASVGFWGDGYYLSGELFVWDVRSSKLLYTVSTGPDADRFDANNARNRAATTPKWVSFSPDNKYLAIQYYDRKVLLRDATTYREIRTLEIGYGVSFSAGKLAVAQLDHLDLWDLSTGKKTSTVPYVERDSDLYYLLSLSADGKYVAGNKRFAGHLRDRVDIIDATTGRTLYKFEGHAANVTSMSFSPTADRLATTSHDRTVRVWNVPTTRKPCKGSELSNIVFSADSRRIIGHNRRGKQRTVAWDANTGNELFSIEGVQLAQSPGGRFIAMSKSLGVFADPTVDGGVSIWDGNSGRQLHEPVRSGRLLRARFSANGTRFLGEFDSTLKVWDVSTGQEIQTFTNIPSARRVQLSPDGKRLVVEFIDGSKVWNVDTGQEVLSQSGYQRQSVFNHDGTRLMIANYHGKAWDWSIWDAVTGKELFALKEAPKDQASSKRLPRPRSDPVLVFGGKGKRIASTLGSVWDATTGEKLAELEGKEKISAITFSPDGERIVDTETAAVWDTSTGKKIASCESRVMAFSPDSKRLATSGGGKSPAISMWDLKTGQEILTIATAHRGQIKSLVFSPDGNLLASADDDDIYIWDGTPFDKPKSVNEPSAK